MRKKYQDRLQELEEKVLEMGNTVSNRYEGALQALADHDEEKADSIGKADDDIDQKYIDIEKICSDLLALQQPVASDLRTITASFKIITDIERVGDLIVNLTDYVKRIEGPHLLDEEEILDLGTFARQMFIDSLSSYEEGDIEFAREIAERDNQMDRMCEEGTTKLLNYLIKWESGNISQSEAENKNQQVLVELLAIRDLERIADHAVNIAARTVYMVSTERDLI